MGLSTMGRTRALFLVFLIILLAFGITLISVGLTNSKVVTEYDHWLSGLEGVSLAIAIASGCGIIGLVLIGFLAFHKDNFISVLVFAGLLSAFALLEIIAGSLAVSASSSSQDTVRQNLEQSMPDYSVNPEEKTEWNRLQRNLKCCGSRSSGQWREALATKNIPISCCPDIKEEGGRNCRPSDDLFQLGCTEALSTRIKSALNITACICFVFAAIQILGIALALYMAYVMKRERDVKVAVVHALTEKDTPKTEPKDVQRVSTIETLRVDNVY